jgi:hypothetical protein
MGRRQMLAHVRLVEGEKIADLLPLDIQDFQKLPLSDVDSAAMATFDQDFVGHDDFCSSSLNV